ncbi:MAG: 3-hydroxyacyl-ACP dehydratase FabZ [Alphaproteobacteria bacterium]|nr:3-hydroxyacyl-ACP dehydratase FabZ [Alphaproteobacteria bacterium]
MSGDELGRLDIEQILACLPQRYPFLMIDRIVDIDGVQSATGLKNITYNEPIFTGHFPSVPIFPGVLIIEGMAQTAGAIVIAANRQDGQNHLVYLVTVENAKFRKPAYPGDQIEYHIELAHLRRNIGKYNARAIVDGRVIAEAKIGAMILPEGTQ